MTVARPHRTGNRGPLGEAVLELRQRRGITQTELARRVGISQGRIGEIESGANRSPKLDTLLRLAAALGVTAAELVAASTPAAQRATGKTRGSRKSLTPA